MNCMYVYKCDWTFKKGKVVDMYESYESVVRIKAACFSSYYEDITIQYNRTTLVIHQPSAYYQTHYTRISHVTCSTVPIYSSYIFYFLLVELCRFIMHTECNIKQWHELSLKILLLWKWFLGKCLLGLVPMTIGHLGRCWGAFTQSSRLDSGRRWRLNTEWFRLLPDWENLSLLIKSDWIERDIFGAG